MSRAGLMLLGLVVALGARAAPEPAESGPVAVSRPAWGDDELLLERFSKASYDTTRLTGDTDADITSLRPGVIWEIPTRRDRRQLSHWTAGVSLNATHGHG